MPAQRVLHGSLWREVPRLAERTSQRAELLSRELLAVENWWEALRLPGRNLQMAFRGQQQLVVEPGSRPEVHLGLALLPM